MTSCVFPGLSHGTDVWLGNAADLVAAGIPLNECICCRDDIMNYLIAKGVEPKLAFQTMESVRKGKGLKPEMEEAMKQNNVPDWYIDSCKKIKYMFPKAHAVAYVMMAFRIAWFKVHRPLAFYWAYFSIRAKGFDAYSRGTGVRCVWKKFESSSERGRKTISAAERTTLEVCHEFYKRGYTFFAPMDIYQSDATRFLVTKSTHSAFYLYAGHWKTGSTQSCRGGVNGSSYLRRKSWFAVRRCQSQSLSFWIRLVHLAICQKQPNDLFWLKREGILICRESGAKLLRNFAQSEQEKK